MLYIIPLSGAVRKGYVLQLRGKVITIYPFEGKFRLGYNVTYILDELLTILVSEFNKHSK